MGNVLIIFYIWVCTVGILLFIDIVHKKLSKKLDRIIENHMTITYNMKKEIKNVESI